MVINLINIEERDFEEVIGNFDLEYLSCYYSTGKFRVMYPGAFVTGLPSLCKDMNVVRRVKYKVRKFPTPDMWNNSHIFPFILSAILRSEKMIKFIVNQPIGSNWEVLGETANVMDHAVVNRVKTTNGRAGPGEMRIDCSNIKIIAKPGNSGGGEIEYIENLIQYATGIGKKHIALTY